MSIFDPRQTGSSGTEPDPNREREDAPLPTRFGRDWRQRRPRAQPESGQEHQAAPDGERPFEDDAAVSDRDAG